MNKIKSILELANEIVEKARGPGNDEKENALTRIKAIRLLADEEAAERTGLPYGDPSHFGEDAEYLNARGMAFNQNINNYIDEDLMELRVKAFYGNPSGQGLSASPFQDE